MSIIPRFRKNIARGNTWQVQNFVEPSQAHIIEDGKAGAANKIFLTRQKPCVSLALHYIGARRSHLDGGEPSVVNTPLVSTPLLQGFAKFLFPHLLALHIVKLSRQYSSFNKIIAAFVSYFTAL